MSYHTAFGIFPPSSVWRNNGNLDASQLDSQSGNYANRWENWVILILPQLDNANLRQTFVTDAVGNIIQPIGGTATGTGRPAMPKATCSPAARILPFMLCPSDPYNRSPFMRLER